MKIYFKGLIQQRKDGKKIAFISYERYVPMDKSVVKTLIERFKEELNVDSIKFCPLILAEKVTFSGCIEAKTVFDVVEITDAETCKVELK